MNSLSSAADRHWIWAGLKAVIGLSIGIACATPESGDELESLKMVYVRKPTGVNRYREEIGRYYEEFSVGDVYEHRPGRTISETENTWFALLTMNTHPLHFDAKYAADSEFGARLVSSTLTLAIVVGMSVSDTSQKAIANLGWKNIRLSAPVFAGDTIYAESEVLDKRESKSRSGAGIVSISTRGLKADGTEFIVMERSFLIPKREQETGTQAV